MRLTPFTVSSSPIPLLNVINGSRTHSNTQTDVTGAVGIECTELSYRAAPSL